MEEADKADKVGDDVKQSSTDAPVPEKAAAPPPPPRPAVEIEDAPDPDEDDLDDLDDMLDEFSAVKPGPAAQPAAPGAAPAGASAAGPKPAGSTGAASGPAPAFNPEELENLSEEDFEKQLEAGMAELMKDLDNSPDMQAQFEEIFKGLGSAASAGGAEPAAPSGSAKPEAAAGSSSQGTGADFAQDANFQETIRRTMARMQESGDQATAAAAAGSSEDDFIAEMMKAMKDMPGGGEGGDEDFSKMLMGMMEQLTNKEILYEPMKELHDKYPGWLEKNKDTLSKEDLKRYQEQQAYVAEMVAKFEEPSFSDSNSADRQYIVERMQKMQEAGSPPSDLIGDMPSAKEVFDAPDESCAPQ